MTFNILKDNAKKLTILYNKKKSNRWEMSDFRSEFDQILDMPEWKSLRFKKDGSTDTEEEYKAIIDALPEDVTSRMPDHLLNEKNLEDVLINWIRENSLTLNMNHQILIAKMEMLFANSMQIEGKTEDERELLGPIHQLNELIDHNYLIFKLELISLLEDTELMDEDENEFIIQLITFLGNNDNIIGNFSFNQRINIWENTIKYMFGDQKLPDRSVFALKYKFFNHLTPINLLTNDQKLGLAKLILRNMCVVNDFNFLDPFDLKKEEKADLFKYFISNNPHEDLVDEAKEVNPWGIEDEKGVEQTLNEFLSIFLEKKEYRVNEVINILDLLIEINEDDVDSPELKEAIQIFKVMYDSIMLGVEEEVVGQERRPGAFFSLLQQKGQVEVTTRTKKLAAFLYPIALLCATKSPVAKIPKKSNEQEFLDQDVRQFENEYNFLFRSMGKNNRLFNYKDKGWTPDLFCGCLKRVWKSKREGEFIESFDSDLNSEYSDYSDSDNDISSDDEF